MPLRRGTGNSRYLCGRGVKLPMTLGEVLWTLSDEFGIRVVS